MPKGLLDTAEALAGLWPAVDRSPLGSAAGYGVPLPLRREAAARALGFAALDHNVATVQGGRGKLEAAALFWCTQLGHELARLSQDVILFSAEEYGYLVLPAELATGSSIMPHKRNPDLFELTRARTAALEGDLVSILQIKSKLAGGYQRDFQLLKEPLMRGLERTAAMLAIVTHAVPLLEVDRARCARRARGWRARDRRGDAAGGAGAAVSHGLPPGGGGARGGRAVSRAIGREAHRPAVVHRWRGQPRVESDPGPRPARPHLALP